MISRTTGALLAMLHYSPSFFFPPSSHHVLFISATLQISPLSSLFFNAESDQFLWQHIKLCFTPMFFVLYWLIRSSKTVIILYIFWMNQRLFTSQIWKWRLNPDFYNERMRVDCQFCCWYEQYISFPFKFKGRDDKRKDKRNIMKKTMFVSTLTLHGPSESSNPENMNGASPTLR